MAEEPAFKRSLGVVALLHVLLVAGFFLAGRWEDNRPKKDIVVWIDGSIGGGDATSETDLRPVNLETPPPPAVPELIKPPSVEPEPPPVPPPPPPVETPPPAEIVTATPAPATPKPTTPKPATPKPSTPKPATPKPATPKPSTPKPATPKASPPATPKPKASPKPTAAEDSASPKPKATPSNQPKGTPAAARTDGAGAATTKLASNTPAGGNGPGPGNGKGPAKTGSGEGLSPFGWYFSMLHDHFHARWEQPTNIARGGAEVVTTVKLRISRDGLISNREIVTSSGFPQMDESVMAAAAKVLQIDPLPVGLGNGEFFEVNVQFKLDQAQ